MRVLCHNSLHGGSLEQLHPCSVCGCATVFLTSNIQYLLFPNLTHKTETGTAKGRTLLTATHPDQSNCLANQQQVLGFTVPFASLSIPCKNAEPKPCCWAKPACFAFSSSKIFCTVHWWSCSYRIISLQKVHHACYICLVIYQHKYITLDLLIDILNLCRGCLSCCMQVEASHCEPLQRVLWTGRRHAFFGETAGSGFIIQSDGTILTNAHVVANERRGLYKGAVSIE
jgi:hypothetical protein